MTAICGLLIGLMASSAGTSVESIPRGISYVVEKDGDITRSVQLVNRLDERVSLELTYKPENIDAARAIWIGPQDRYDLTVTLRVPEGTWAEALEIRSQMDERVRRRERGRNLPPMVMLSKLGYEIRSSAVEAVDTLEINLMLRYDFDPEESRNERFSDSEKPQ
jgi:hypothetical protein